MVGLAVISNDNSIYNTIIKLTKSFKWIHCDKFNSIDNYFSEKKIKYKIIVVDQSNLDDDWKYDNYSITERVYSIEKNVKILFLKNEVKTISNLRNLMMKIFQASLGYKSVSN